MNKRLIWIAVAVLVLACIAVITMSCDFPIDSSPTSAANNEGIEVDVNIINNPCTDIVVEEEGSDKDTETTVVPCEGEEDDDTEPKEGD